MAGHKTTIIPAANNQWQAQCSCRKASAIVKDYIGAVTWEQKHQGEVAQVKAHLAGRAPSLKDQRDYYRERAEDTAVPEADRLLWTQLADELDRRLGEKIVVERPQLF